MRPIRLLLETSGSGAWNMAVDEVLLDRALETGEASVRIYQWSEATLSLGYFQKLAEAGDLARQLPTVRRLSGGGAILHHHELTYSLAIPPGHPAAADPHGLYVSVHQSIRQLLAEFGHHVQPRGTVQPELNSQFLCFARGDAVDLVVPPRDAASSAHADKVLGSAQRRRKGAILQHGSLVLRASEHAPQFPGLVELNGLPVDEASLFARLGTSLVTLLGEARISRLTPAETLDAESRQPSYRMLGE